jgi:hypothetical protein
MPFDQGAACSRAPATELANSCATILPTEGVFRQMLSTISGTGQCAEQKQAEIAAQAAADAARQAMWCGRLEHGARNRECPLLQSPTFPKSST